MTYGLAALLFLFPKIAITESNTIDPEKPTFKGIPFNTIKNSVHKISLDYSNPITVYSQSYVLLVDICHSFAYILEYAQEYVSFP